MIEIRSSSWGDLLDCAARWSAIHIEKIYRPSSVPAMMGTAIHYGTAIYDSAKVEQRTPSIEEAVEAAHQKVRQPDEEIKWMADDYSRRQAEEITIKATELYCREVSPLYEYSAVELRPVPLDIDVDGQIIRITGQMDRTRIIKDPLYENGEGITDVKTGKRIVDSQGKVSTKGFKFQLGVYEILTEHSYGRKVTLPAQIAAVSTAKQPKAGTAAVYDAKALMLGTPEEPGIIETAGRMVKAGLFPPNPYSRLCSEKFCPIYHRCKAHD